MIVEILIHQGLLIYIADVEIASKAHDILGDNSYCLMVEEFEGCPPEVLMWLIKCLIVVIDL